MVNFLSRWLPIQFARITAGLLGALLVVVAVAPAAAQPDRRAHTERIPERAAAAVVVFPQVLLENPRFKAFPREILTALTRQEFGFDPMLIEQATLVIPPLENLQAIQEVPPYALIMRFQEMQGLSGDRIAGLEQQQLEGRQAYINPEPGLPSFVIYDEATLIAGHDIEFLRQVIRGNPGPMAKWMAGAELQGDVQIYLDLQALRPALAEVVARLPPLPEPLEALKGLPEEVDRVTLSMSLRGRWQTDVQLTVGDAAAAPQVAQAIEEALEFGRRALLAEMLRQMDPGDPVQRATIEYTDRVWQSYQPKWTPQVEGRRLSMTFHEELLAIPFLAGVLERPVRRTLNPPYSSQNRLRQIALAALNYESAFRKLPPHSILDDAGRPLMSGRVATLPFVEQANIYENLRQDEPWDSPHNRQFTDLNLEIFGDPTGEGMIRYPVFPGSIWDDNGGKSLGDVTDGTSNTILAIQAPPGQEVNWADPSPWKISATHPMADVFGDREQVMVVFLDGHTETLRRSEMTNEKLKALLTIAGGETVR